MGTMYLGVCYYTTGERIVYDMGFDFCEKEDCVVEDYRAILRGLQSQKTEDMEYALSECQLPIFSAERKVNGEFKVLRRFVSKDIAKALNINISDVISVLGDNIRIIIY